MYKLLIVLVSCVIMGCGKSEPEPQPPDETQMIQESNQLQEKALKGQAVPAG